ncbi:MAG: hypothetical protein AAGE01_00975 [Pseudomonadota bacterium]
MKNPAAGVLDRERVRRPTQSLDLPRTPAPRQQLWMELLSGGSGLLLALFM